VLYQLFLIDIDARMVNRGAKNAEPMAAVVKMHASYRICATIAVSKP
jgi:hypothetical protein